ncbi:MAG: DUF1330 domain-containing protein [Acidobacteria bacterium]|nr:DUF1330 domain-containing protein [Acidobacteriota bacterium]
MWVVATLTPRDGDWERFEAYERKAAQILARHGARIVRAIREQGAPGREVHVVHFPSPAALEAYRADPDTAALAAEREAAIALTELILGDDAGWYGKA